MENFVNDFEDLSHSMCMRCVYSGMIHTFIIIHIISLTFFRKSVKKHFYFMQTIFQIKRNLEFTKDHLDHFHKVSKKKTDKRRQNSKKFDKNSEILANKRDNPCALTNNNNYKRKIKSDSFE